uniref:Peroxisomal biogenesis factor 19 n=1 Tax=Ciona intestinalis TaxID=7719 RepID=F6ZES6_CIOIN
RATIFVMDADLDDLLDDALNDFEAVSLNENKPPAAKPVKDEAVEAAGTSNKDGDALKQGEEWMKSINELTGNAGGDPEQAAQMRAFQKEMMKGLDPNNPLFAPMDGSKDPPKSYEDAMKETLEFLSKGPDATSSGEDDPLDKIFDEMMGAGGDGELGMMENMMKSMLSKDMLYPPMKEMCNEYPVWLEKKGSELPVDVRSNYEQQLSFLRQICHEFESEKDSDPEKVKNQRFQKIMELINSMQQYGQPPTDL